MSQMSKWKQSQVLAVVSVVSLVCPQTLMMMMMITVIKISLSLTHATTPTVCHLPRIQFKTHYHIIHVIYSLNCFVLTLYKIHCFILTLQSSLNLL